MKKKTTTKKEKPKQVVEIHIYVHQTPNWAGTAYPNLPTLQCTCGRTNTTCPIHGNAGGGYIITCSAN